MDIDDVADLAVVKPLLTSNHPRYPVNDLRPNAVVLGAFEDIPVSIRSLAVVFVAVEVKFNLFNEKTITFQL